MLWCLEYNILYHDERRNSFTLYTVSGGRFIAANKKCSIANKRRTYLIAERNRLRFSYYRSVTLVLPHVKRSSTY